MAKKKKGSGFKLTINWSKWLVASIAVFVVMFGFDFLVHGNLLKDLYAANSRLFLGMAESQARMAYMLAGQLSFAAAFVFLYSQGYSGKGSVAEGLRYGLYVGLLIGVPHSLGMYMWSLFPVSLLQAWAAACVVGSVIAGGVAGALYSHK